MDQKTDIFSVFFVARTYVVYVVWVDCILGYGWGLEFGFWILEGWRMGILFCLRDEIRRSFASFGRSYHWFCVFCRTASPVLFWRLLATCWVLSCTSVGRVLSVCLSVSHVDRGKKGVSLCQLVVSVGGVEFKTALGGCWWGGVAVSMWKELEGVGRSCFWWLFLWLFLDAGLDVSIEKQEIAPFASDTLTLGSEGSCSLHWFGGHGYDSYLKGDIRVTSRVT